MTYLTGLKLKHKKAVSPTNLFLLQNSSAVPAQIEQAYADVCISVAIIVVRIILVPSLSRVVKFRLILVPSLFFYVVYV